MQLQTLLDAVSLLTFATAFMFGILEIRRAARGRTERGAIELFTSVVIQPDHVAALNTVLSLPEHSPRSRIAGSRATMRCADLLINQFEFWGVMAFQRIVPLHTLDLLMGGGVRASWRRLDTYIQSDRRKKGNPNLGEWLEWLAGRLEEHPAPQKKLGAHVAFKDWEP